MISTWGPALAIIAASIILLVLQVFLSFRKNKWFGLIPVFLIVAIALSLTLYSVSEVDSYQEENLVTTTSNGYTLNMAVRYDGNGDLVDFSNVDVLDEDENRLDTLWIDFNSKGNVVEDDSSRIYVKDIEVLVGDHKLTGSPTYDSEVKNMVRMPDYGYFTPASFLFIAITPCIVLLLIHIIIRTATKKKRIKKELDRINIDNL